MSKQAQDGEKEKMSNTNGKSNISKTPKFIPFNYDGTSQETKPYIEKVKPINDTNTVK